MESGESGAAPPSLPVLAGQGQMPEEKHKERDIDPSLEQKREQGRGLWLTPL